MTAVDLPLVEDLTAIVDQIFSSLLDAYPVIVPVATPGTSPEADPGSASARAAWVTIHGDLPMLVATSASLDDATAVARHVLEVDEPVLADVDDALGELANVVGGNVKSLLPGTSSLSLPHVTADAVPVPLDAVRHQSLQAIWGQHTLQLDTWVLPH